MNRRRTSIDGFVARRPHRVQLGEHSGAKSATNLGHTNTDPKQTAALHTDSAKNAMPLSMPRKSSMVEDINGSLKSIDSDTDSDKKKRTRRRKKRKNFKTIAMVVTIILVAAIGFLIYKAWSAGGKMFSGDMLGIFQQQELKMDKHGRSNVLILGSTDDMEGRDGATLTDSMMVISVDQKKKDAYMFSIPRDLWVKYGQACFTGYEGKINAFYTCADDGDGKEAETARMNATKKLVGDIFGMDIQYAVHVNTVVIRDGVNAVGGITVNVEGDDERGVLDSIFDDMCKNARDLCPSGHFVDFSNGPNQMNGDQAMAFSQARGMGALTYGLSGSNFAREKNQQLVLMALKEKATSTGTLTDITKVLSLVDAMGNNLRTDIETKEIQTIMKLASEIEMTDIHRLSFYEEDNRLMTTGMVGDQSAVYPVAGQYNYSQIRKYLNSAIYATPLSKEGARVAVLNGGGPVGAAQTRADELSEHGMTISYVDNSPETVSQKYVIYRLAETGAKPLAEAKLEELLGAKITKSRPPFTVSVDSDFVVVIGPSS